MKKLLIRALCLLLCLLLPSAALAEPLPWLAPATRALNHENATTVITAELDADHLTALFQAIADATERQFREWMNWSEDEGDGAEEEDLPYILPETPAYIAYLPAVAALVEESAVTLTAGNGSIRADFAISGQHWFDFTFTLSPDGHVLLLSDLFPSFALDLELLDPLVGLGRWAEYAQRSVPLLTDYMDYPLMEELLAAYGKAMEALADRGTAQRTEEGITYDAFSVYTGDEALDPLQDDALYALLQSGEMNLDPRLSRALRALTRLDEQSTLADRRREAQQWIDNGVALSVSIPVSAEISRHHSLKDGEWTLLQETTEYSKNLSKEGLSPQEGPGYPSTNTSALRLSPSGLSIQQQGDYSDWQIDVSWGGDEIQADYHLVAHYSGREDEDDSFSARLTRDENGQRAVLTASGMSLTAVLPMTLQNEAAWNNDVDALQYSASVDWGEGPLSIGALNVDVSYDGDLPAAPDLAGITAFSPATDDREILDAFKKEIRAVAIPRLNRLVLTGLPQDARPLMSTLLAMVSSLGYVAP